MLINLLQDADEGQQDAPAPGGDEGGAPASDDAPAEGGEEAGEEAGGDEGGDEAAGDEPAA